jgi:hypothetical protein
MILTPAEITKITDAAVAVANGSCTHPLNIVHEVLWFVSHKIDEDAVQSVVHQELYRRRKQLTYHIPKPETRF